MRDKQVTDFTVWYEFWIKTHCCLKLGEIWGRVTSGEKVMSFIFNIDLWTQT